ncbi:cytochrome P450 [Qaidamihabitans albus]|uniref:cytochrome P450 n=1 Tax=Qaidamihabitans albus TaxID=2795733 RepID=UPI0018F168C2|nr:cytochrome P450 [Qaidamihabitans albus]
MPLRRPATNGLARTINYPPAEALAWAHRRRGPVVRLAAGSRRFAYLLGPEANRFVFANDDLFRVREAFAGLVPVDGPTSLIVSDGADHRRRRRLVQPAMHHRRVGGYLRIMADNADAAVGGWASGKRIDAYLAFRAAIRRSTLRSLFGPRLALAADELAADLQPLLDLVDHLPDVITLHRRLRTPLWRRAAAARARVDARIHAEIGRARAHGTDADEHVLAELVHGRTGDGTGLSDDEVRDQMVTLIAAGYETTSAAMAWTIYTLGTHPEARARARREVTIVLGDRPPEPEDLKRLPYLQAAVSEALRLYPPAVLSARHAAADFELAGQHIRAGTTVLYSPYFTHRSEQVYPGARDFRPERWLTADDEPRRPPPHEYLPFGGGAHRCIGSTMATTELCVMLARLLARHDYRIPPQRLSATGFAAMRPRHGLLIDIA